MLQDAEFIRHFGAAQHAEQGALGFEDFAQVAKIRAQEIPRRRAGEVFDDSCGGRVSAVRGSEGLVDIEIRQRRQGFGKGRFVLGLARVEAKILQQQELSVAQGLACREG